VRRLSLDEASFGLIEGKSYSCHGKTGGAYMSGKFQMYSLAFDGQMRVINALFDTFHVNLIDLTTGKYFSWYVNGDEFLTTED
jgi:hypothetical protein